MCEGVPWARGSLAVCVCERLPCVSGLCARGSLSLAGPCSYRGPCEGLPARGCEGGSRRFPPRRRAGLAPARGALRVFLLLRVCSSSTFNNPGLRVSLPAMPAFLPRRRLPGCTHGSAPPQPRARRRGPCPSFVSPPSAGQRSDAAARAASCVVNTRRQGRTPLAFPAWKELDLCQYLEAVCNNRP